MTADERRDKEANCFARCLLMPSFMVKNEIEKMKTIDKNGYKISMSFEEVTQRLAAIFQVSEPIMAVRLHELFPNKF